MKISKQLSIGAGLLALAAPSARAEVVQFLAMDQVEFSAETLSWSESISIKGAFNGLASARLDLGGNESFTHSEVRATVKGDHLGVFATTRYDYYTKYNPDVAPLLVNNVNGNLIKEGAYDVDISLNEVQASGVGVVFAHNISNTISVSASMTALSLHRFTDGKIEGQVTAPRDGAYWADVTADYYYTHDIILDRQVEDPNGYGVTTDLELAWEPTKDLTIAVEARDLYSDLRWDDAPRTELDSSTTRVTVAEDGLLNVRPYLSGRETYEDHKQRYNPRLVASVAYDMNERWTVEQSAMKVEDITLAESRVTWQANDELQVSGSAEWTSGAVGAAVKWKNIGFEVATNSLDVNQASYLKASISIGVNF